MPRLRWRIISAFVTVVCLCAAVIINACSGGSPSPYVGRLDPIIGQWTAYGTGTGFAAQLSNPFAIPTEASGKTINYVYTAPLGLVLGRTMTLNYSIDGNATFAPLPESSCGTSGCGPAKLRLFIWGSTSDTSSDRWWCDGPKLVIADGQTYYCVIDQTWTGVQGQTGNPLSSSPFAVGFTFGGMFAGHGVWTTSGTATLKVNSFTVQ